MPRKSLQECDQGCGRKQAPGRGAPAGTEGKGTGADPPTRNPAEGGGRRALPARQVETNAEWREWLIEQLRAGRRQDRNAFPQWFEHEPPPQARTCAYTYTRPAAATLRARRRLDRCLGGGGRHFQVCRALGSAESPECHGAQDLRIRPPGQAPNLFINSSRERGAACDAVPDPNQGESIAPDRPVNGSLNHHGCRFLAASEGCRTA